ncbi:MAG: MFS transporter [Rhodobacter sp.]|nr:MFS transporter [Paracoccaceae bacterium]MCC0076270.1 MFS transporter [Rhodobacter sp.]
MQPVETTPTGWSAMRPVLTLGLTQIVGFGTLFYAFGVIVTPMSADLGLSVPFAYAALSAALLVGSLAAPAAGRMVDRFGARVMMASGSLVTAAVFAALSQVQGAWGLVAVLAVAEIVAALVLYDAAFAALAQIFGQTRARRAITQMTLMGGFASTVFWPLTLALVEGWGWRVTYGAFALFHLVLCLPLHLSLPRKARGEAPHDPTPPRFAPLPPSLRPRAMVLVAIAFAVSWTVMSAFSAQWVPALGAMGLTEAAAVAAGALMGPAQVGARVIEMLFAHNRHPMVTALIAMSCLTGSLVVLALGPAGFATAAVFAVLFGIGQGLGTVIRGTVPLALFGTQGFAARLGRLASLRQLVGALSPFAMAGSLALFGPGVTLMLAGILALVALAAFWSVPWRVRG